MSSFPVPLSSPPSTSSLSLSSPSASSRSMQFPRTLPYRSPVTQLKVLLKARQTSCCQVLETPGRPRRSRRYYEDAVTEYLLLLMWSTNSETLWRLTFLTSFLCTQSLFYISDFNLYRPITLFQICMKQCLFYMYLII